jgi:hypothetical protein
MAGFFFAAIGQALTLVWPRQSGLWIPHSWDFRVAINRYHVNDEVTQASI